MANLTVVEWSPCCVVELSRDCFKAASDVAELAKMPFEEAYDAAKRLGSAKRTYAHTPVQEAKLDTCLAIAEKHRDFHQNRKNDAATPQEASLHLFFWQTWVQIHSAVYLISAKQ